MIVNDFEQFFDFVIVVFLRFFEFYLYFSSICWSLLIKTVMTIGPKAFMRGAPGDTPKTSNVLGILLLNDKNRYSHAVFPWNGRWNLFLHGLQGRPDPKGDSATQVL